MKELLKTFLYAALLLGLFFGLTPNFEAGQAEALAAINKVGRVTLMDGTTSYTDAQTSGTVYVANYANVQVQAVSDILTVTHSITVTPQFANDSWDCSLASQYTSATAWLIFESDNLTDTVLEQSEVMDILLTGDTGLNRTVPVQGGCMRFSITMDAGATYTPSIYLRLVDQ